MGSFGNFKFSDFFLCNVGHMNIRQMQQGLPKRRLVLYNATLNDILEGSTQTWLRLS